MIFLLFAFLLVFLTIIFKKTRDVFHPAFLLTACYTFSCFFCVLSYKQLGTDISFTTFIVVALTAVLFSVPSIIICERVKYCGEKDYKIMTIPLSYKIFFFLFFLLVDVLYARYIINMARIGGYTGGLTNIFTFAQIAIFNDQVDSSMGFVLNYGLKLSKAIGYIVSFELMQGFVYRKLVKPKHLGISFLIFILFVFQCILSTGRTQIIYLLIFLLCIYAFLKRQQYLWKKDDNKKFLFFFIVIGVFGLLIFRIIGTKFRGSIYGTTSDTWANLFKYIGSPIYALDEYLSKPSFSSFFGEETLYTLYSALHKIGLWGDVKPNNLGFVDYLYEGVSTTTNVYGAVRRYIHDYSVFTVFILVLEGCFFGTIYKHIRKYGCNSFSFIAYSKISYVLVFFFFEERFLVDIFTLSNGFTFFFLYIFYRLFTHNYSCAKSKQKTAVSF